MHEHSPVLSAKPRQRLGSRHTRRIRAGGGLPAIIYGHKQDPVPITLDARETMDQIHRGDKVFQLAMDGTEEKQMVLLKDLQYDYLGTNVIHVDLARVSIDELVRVRVPIRTIGEAVGLKHAGAVMMHGLSEIEIECLVTNLPEYIELDVTDVDLGRTLTAGEVPLPLPTMRLLTEPSAMVAHIVIQGADKSAEEEEVQAEDAGAPEKVGEPDEKPEGTSS